MKLKNHYLLSMIIHTSIEASLAPIRENNIIIKSHVRPITITKSVGQVWKNIYIINQVNSIQVNSLPTCDNFQLQDIADFGTVAERLATDASI
jgi:hypothetical protein